MIYKMKNTGAKVEVELKGRLTYSDYGLFRQITDVIGSTQNQHCILDLSDLEFIDSAGLGMLLLARDKVNNCKGVITLRNANGQVKKMVDLGRFDTLFQIDNV